MKNKIYTIGHSTHSIEKLLDIIKINHVSAIADVRSTPYSKINPQFNKEVLKKSLNNENIKYVHLGRELGIPVSDSNSNHGIIEYVDYISSRFFSEGIDRILRGSSKYLIAIMCAEKDPLTCHRFLFISNYLSTKNHVICHILEDGSIESHKNAITRLLEEEKLSTNDLFLSQEDIINRALRLRWEKVSSLANNNRVADNFLD